MSTEALPNGPSTTPAERRVEQPLAENILYCNQPSPEPNPLTIEILDETSIAISGVEYALSLKERAIFNVLATNRTSETPTSAFLDHGFPEAGTQASTMNSLSKALRNFRKDFTIAKREIIIPKQKGQHKAYTFDKDVLVLDLRGQPRPEYVKREREARAPKSQKRSYPRRPKGTSDTGELMSRDVSRPFVDMELARKLVPDVFEAKYDNTTDRLIVQDMLKATANDTAIMNRVDRVYKIKKGNSAHSDVIPESFDAILAKAGQYRLLEDGEEPILARKIKDGVAAYKALETAVDARQKEVLIGLVREGAYGFQAMFHTNLRLAARPAKNNAPHNPHLEAADIIQQAYEGVQRAVEKFDEDKGYKFSTYGLIWIKQAIQRGIDDEGRVLRLPTNISQKTRKIEKKRRELTQELGRKPTDEEIKAAAEVTDEMIEIDRKHGSRSMASLNKPAGEDGESEFGDFIPDDSDEDQLIEELDRQNIIKEIFNNEDLSLADKFLLSYEFEVEVEELKGRYIYLGPGRRHYYEDGIAAIFQASNTSGKFKSTLLGIRPDKYRQTVNDTLQKASSFTTLKEAA